MGGRTAKRTVGRGMRTPGAGVGERKTVPASGGLPNGFLPITLSDGTSVGVLLMDVSALHSVSMSRLSAAGFPKPLVPALASWALEVALPGLAHQTSRLLDVEVAVLPLELAASRFAGHPNLLREHWDRCLSLLETLASDLKDQSPGLLAELPGFPFTRIVRQQVESRGTDAQKRLLRKILKKVTQGKRGRPYQPLESSSDTQLLQLVDALIQEIHEDFTCIQERQRESNFDEDEIRDALRRKGYEHIDITILLQSRTVRAAAVKLAAHYSPELRPGRPELKPRSVDAAVSRAKRRQTAPSR